MRVSNPMAFHVSRLNLRKFAGFEFFECVRDAAASAGVNFYAAGIKRGKRLWPDMAGNDRLHAERNDIRASLYTCALGGIEVLHVVNG